MENIRLFDQNVRYPIAAAGPGFAFASMVANGHENRGRVFSVTASGGDVLPLLDSEGDFSAPHSCEIPGGFAVSFTESREGQRRWHVIRVVDGKPAGHAKGPWAHVKNPRPAWQGDRLVLVMENHQGPHAVVEILYFSGEKLEPSAPILVTHPHEIAYRPFPVSMKGRLVVVYEAFQENRYHLRARLLDTQSFASASPFHLGFDDGNDQGAWVCIQGDQIAVVWENAKPLKKGWVWKGHGGNQPDVIMPGFGHGWQVEARMGLQLLTIEKDGIMVSDFPGTNHGVLDVDDQKSSGAPCIYACGEGLGLSWLRLVQQPFRDWKWMGAVWDGRKWEPLKDTGLMLRARVPSAPAIAGGEIFIAGLLPGRRTAAQGQQGNEGIWSVPMPMPRSAVLHRHSGHLPAPVLVKPRLRPETRLSDGTRTLFWADLHMHSNLSGCSLGTSFHCTELEEKLRWARDVGDLDITLLTDHDCLSEAEWNRTRSENHFHDRPGSFTSFVGVEWTTGHFNDKANFGHFNILYRDDGPNLPTRDHRTDTLEKIWNKLPRGRALTIPHHPGQPGFEVDWNYFDPRFEKLVEIFQVRGSYEADSCLMDPTLYGREKVVPHRSIQYALNRGYRFGFTAGGEHEGVGVTGVWAKDLSREGVFEALQNRHTFASTGDHLRLEFRVEGALMGSDVRVKSGKPRITAQVTGTAPLDFVHIVRDGKILKRWEPQGCSFVLEYLDENLGEAIGPRTRGFLGFGQRMHHYYYLVVRQKNDQMGWSSPVFVRA